MNKILKWTGIVLGGLIGLILLTGLVLYPSGKEKLTRSYPNIPVETVNIPTGPEAISRGRHVSIVWGCTKCHGEDLSGMPLASDPFLGTISASNLTSSIGGIAKSYSDADWTRAIRHGVKPNGRVEVFMYDYSTMSDQDLGALIAYLKQIPPVDSDYPALKIGPISAIGTAMGIFTPAAEQTDHGASSPPDPAPGATIEYGKYLSTLCVECHGSRLASKLENWTQEDFIRAIKNGVLPNGRQLNPTMYSKNFGEMNDTELTALWLYLMNSKP